MNDTSIKLIDDYTIAAVKSLLELINKSENPDDMRLMFSVYNQLSSIKLVLVSNYSANASATAPAAVLGVDGAINFDNIKVLVLDSGTVFYYKNKENVWTKISPYCIALLENNQYITAIKELRSESGFGLKETKDVMDSVRSYYRKYKNYKY